jgi:hypothetical protein
MRYPTPPPVWLPGDDYYTNFHEGDPFIKVPEGYARLPGAGYEALHPELKDVDPEDYPDIHRMAMLADVAPYSREYNLVSPSCRTQKHLARARQTEAPSMVPPRPFWLPRPLQIWQARMRSPSCLTPRAHAGNRLCSQALRQSEYQQLSTRAQAAGLPVMGIGDLQAGMELDVSSG